MALYFFANPVHSEAEGLIHGCSNREHFSRNKGWVNFKDSIEEILRRDKINVDRERMNLLLHDIADVVMNVNYGQNRQSFMNMSAASALYDYLGPDSRRCNFVFGPLLYIFKLFAAANPPQPALIAGLSLVVPPPPPPSQPTQASGVISSSSLVVPPPPPPSQQTQAVNGAGEPHGKPLKRQKTIDWCCKHCGRFNDVDFHVVLGHEGQCSFKPHQRPFGVGGV